MQSKWGRHKLRWERKGTKRWQVPLGENGGKKGKAQRQGERKEEVSLSVEMLWCGRKGHIASRCHLKDEDMENLRRKGRLHGTGWHTHTAWTRSTPPTSGQDLGGSTPPGFGAWSSRIPMSTWRMAWLTTLRSTTVSISQTSVTSSPTATLNATPKF